ncbi:hypothetical protein [Streptomyces liliifuscus]|uniref:Uncharacterized protein n=1 Tax=Streptomyces liliifuscus TaxID=2797636 RepID=A0A7T7I1G0_9ACTN|nr:hypothetical protein [Streptomyces liliifuscus]QQM39269.1 hypothetical protein JEQ17_07185 [Streptomyces liliifuscus]
MVAPVFGARTLQQLHDGLGAVALTLDDVGTSQRDRRLQGGAQALGDLIVSGSEHPTGRL